MVREKNSLTCCSNALFHACVYGIKLVGIKQMILSMLHKNMHTVQTSISSISLKDLHFQRSINAKCLQFAINHPVQISKNGLCRIISMFASWQDKAYVTE